MKAVISEYDRERVERDWQLWWNHELDRPIVVIERLEGYDVAPELIPDVVKHVVDLPLEMPVERILDFYEGILQRTRYYGDAFPRWYPDFGPGVLAAFIGAEPEVVDHSVWYAPLAEGSINDLLLSPDPDNYWWQKVRNLTEAGVNRFGRNAVVGFVDLGGNLDILASVFNSEDLLMALLQQPDDVERVSREITGLWLNYYRDLSAVIASAGAGSTAWAQMWAPGSFYMLQSDFSIMISPAMFEKFVIPDLAECSEQIEYPFYHLDGPGALRHLDSLLSLERLRGIQWIPGAGAPPPEAWLPELKRIRDAGKLCQVYVSPEGARTIVRELGGKGFCFVIFEGVGHEDAESFLKTLN